MGLNFAKEHFSITSVHFLKVKYKIVQHFNLVYVYEPMKIWTFLLPYSDFSFLALFLSFFLAPLFSLPFALHILSVCHKKLGDQGVLPHKGLMGTRGESGYVSSGFLSLKQGSDFWVSFLGKLLKQGIGLG